MQKTLISFIKRFLLILTGVCVLAVPLMPASAASAGMLNGLPDLTTLVEKVGPAVVNIRTVEKIQARRNPAMDMDQDFQEYLFRFFGIPAPDGRTPDRQPQEQVRRGMGSGFIITADGYILTNHHVIDNADEVFVRLTDNREFRAKIIGSDKRTDVALLKIEGNSLPVLKTGNSAKIRVGEWVLAIGSPFALENTVTAGIISAKARDTGDYLPLIQTDVAVNPGNSGGPLINMAGEAIGINSQIYSRSGGYMGISFAIPIDEALRVSEQLKKTGKVTRGQIGIQVAAVSGETAKAMNLPNDKGVMVARVEKGSAAEKAGVEAGDIILRFNHHAIEKMSELPRLVGESVPGTKASLTILRKGKSLVLPVTISRAELDKPAAKNGYSSSQQGDSLSSSVLGLQVADLTAPQKKRLGINHGVVVTASANPAFESGIRKGDVILRINNSDVTDRQEFQNQLAKTGKAKTVVLLVARNNLIRYVPVKPAVK